MPTKISVLPLAAESLGVRSMCTHVETPDLRILVDAGVSLSPTRFGLTPHPFEFQALRESRFRIAEFAEKADVVTISHYHFDHHTPSYEDWLCHWTDAEIARQIYQDKLVLAKNYRSGINPSQRRRGWVFEKTGGKYARRLLFADGCNFSFGGTRIRFSRPVPHGLRGTPLGWVLMVIVEYEDEKVLCASDVQGPMEAATLQLILVEEPQLMMVSGPPLYLAGFKVTVQQIQQGLRNLEILARTIPVTIVEHHLLRDLEWRRSIQEVFKTAKKSGNRLVSAAEFLGKEDKLLEARRKHLFEETPPSQDYKKWAKLPEQKRRRTKPPF